MPEQSLKVVRSINNTNQHLRSMTKPMGLRRSHVRKRWPEHDTYNSTCDMPPQNGHHFTSKSSDAHTKIISPATSRWIILATYVFMWSTFYLMVHYFPGPASLMGNTTSNIGYLRSVFSIVCVELIKGCVSLGALLYLHPSFGVFAIPSIMTSSCIRSLIKSYAPVAMLYALYNNLMFLNLSINYPTAYLILTSSRLLLTSLIWRTLFRTRIKTRMKIAICFVTCGMLAKVGSVADLACRIRIDIMQTLTSTNVLLILLQMMCSVLAGLYNEKLLKSDNDFSSNGVNVLSFGLTHPQSNLHLQNIALCLDSIGINLVIMLGLWIAMLPGKELSVVESTLFSLPSIYTILTLAASGIMTSVVLRYENSITKGLASAFEVVLTSIIEYTFFQRTFEFGEVLGMLLVFIGTIISVVPGINVRSIYSCTPNNAFKPVKILPFIVMILSLLPFLAFDAKHFLTMHGVMKVFQEVEEVCPKAISNSIRPEDIDELQYSRVLQGENVVRYIISELDKKGAIASIMYGTLLSEHRNGTGPCIQYILRDKDFDIALFEPHFFLVLDMVEDIKTKFGFKVWLRKEERLFINFLPIDQTRLGAGFQIDVYGFRVNTPKNGLIYFPHDEVIVASDAFLPLVKHKTLSYNDHDISSHSKTHYLYYYRPFNVSCFLANMYGTDWRTPKKGHFIRLDAYEFPCQRSILSPWQQKELNKQLRIVNSIQRNLIGTDFGKKFIVSCVESKDDVIHLMGLAHSFKMMDRVARGKLMLELYHVSILSPYLTAVLESIGRVRVIRIESHSTCESILRAKALSYETAFVHPSTLLQPQSIRRKTLDGCSVVASRTGWKIGTYHSSENNRFDYIDLNRNVIFWAPYYEQETFDCKQSPFSTNGIIQDIIRQRSSHMQTLLLDRPGIGWIAFDGGLVETIEPETCQSFNSHRSAKRVIDSSLDSRMILNIDVTMMKNCKSVGAHSSTQIGPIAVKGEDRNNNPCLTNTFIDRWFDDNPYRHYGSNTNDTFQTLSTLDELVGLALNNDASIVFDLKGPEFAVQEAQAKQIVTAINGRNLDVGLRFFADGVSALEVIPDQLLSKQTKPNIYVNTPSKIACIELEQHFDLNLKGCFVSEEHTELMRHWYNISQTYSLAKSLKSTETRIICDVPTSSSRPHINPMYWRRGLIECVESGYDYIHYPFPVSTNSDYAMPLSSSLLNTMSNVDGSILIIDKLSSFVRKGGSGEKFERYISHWGFASSYHWPSRQQHSFMNNTEIISLSSQEDSYIFRCVTKILTVMLFLRLEELELASLDDAVSTPSGVPTIWRHIFANTAGPDGSLNGNEFEYSNDMWSFVSGFVEKTTGVSFVEAINYYILKPMGVGGYFDSETPFPPLAARGFRGSNEDLLLIGSTLNSGGISPKTRLRVISHRSAAKMLDDWTFIQNVTTSFKKNLVTKTMDRFAYNRAVTKGLSIVDGYGMGLWRVKGWRKRTDKSAVQGWLSIGSSEALLYFDEDIVVSMVAEQRVIGLELTPPFKEVVKALGNRINEEISEKMKQNEMYVTTKEIRSL